MPKYRPKHRILLYLLCLGGVVPAGSHAQKKELRFEKQRTEKDAPYRTQVNQIGGPNSPLLEKVFELNASALRPVLKKADDYRLQIIFTQINRDKYNRPYVKHHTWRYRPEEYFFPASAVKMATAAIALEHARQLGMPADAELRTFASGGCSGATGLEEMSLSYGHACLRHYVKDVFLVSGNLSYDRLYEFVGPGLLNRRLWEKGYPSYRIRTRYGQYCSEAQNRITNRMIFYGPDGSPLYEQPQDTAEALPPAAMRRTVVGTALLQDGALAPPKDFRMGNAASLEDLHKVLMALVLPQVVAPSERFRLAREDYQLLHKYMSMLPTESSDPQYDAYYSPTCMKYLFCGTRQPLPGADVRIFNKVGQAYGFLTDCAYIVDFGHNVEFMLSATLYCNEDGVLNDDLYDYERIGFPFLRQLGQILLDLERSRNKPYKPDLSFYRHNYAYY